jgi:hypothetical protein
MTAPPARLTSLQPAAYWFTIADCCLALGCHERTIRRHLHRIPLSDRLLVTKRVSGTRSTRFWRISPTGLRILGHSTGLAKYL